MTLSQSVLFATWKFVYLKTPIANRVSARWTLGTKSGTRTAAGRPSHWFHCPRPLDPTQLTVAPHAKSSLIRACGYVEALSPKRCAGEARAPSVISSIDRRARVGSAGMNPLPWVREARRFKRLCCANALDPQSPTLP